MISTFGKEVSEMNENKDLMRNPDDEQLELMYRHKAASCKRRLISFELSFAEYKNLIQMRNDPSARCDYSGSTFIFKENHKHYPTIERIDDREGYKIGNVCIVTSDANSIKDKYIDKGRTIEEKDMQHVGGLVTRIKNVLSDPIKMNEIRTKYIPTVAQKAMAKDISLSNGFRFNPELEITSAYFKNGKNLERANVEFLVTYSEFKRKYQRNACALTGRELTKRAMFVINKDEPITKKNILILDANVQNALDYMISSLELTPEETKTLFKNLGKL